MIDDLHVHGGMHSFHERIEDLHAHGGVFYIHGPVGDIHHHGGIIYDQRPTSRVEFRTDETAARECAKLKKEVQRMGQQLKQSLAECENLRKKLGIPMLNKPVRPGKLRAVMSHQLKASD